MNKADFGTVEELADLLSLNRKTIYDMVKEGELPGAQRCKGTIRIHKPTVLAWFAAGDVTAKQHWKRK